MSKRRLMLIAAMWAALISASAGSADAQSAERFILTGVVFVEGGTGRAWLQEPTLTHNEVVSVRPGDSIGPYRLTKVLEDRVELEGPAGKFVVRLAGPAGAATVAASKEPQPQPPTPGLGATAPAPTATAVAEPPQPVFGPDVIVISRDDPRRKFDFGALLRNLPSVAGDRR